MSEKHTPVVGEVIAKEDDVRRDAIHVALEPVIAGEDLHPGDHVGFVDSERTTMGKTRNTLAIVDPLLKGPVKKGQRFYAWVYPGTVTSLRHEWEHPGFAPLKHAPSIEKSMQWLRDFADLVNLSYEDVIEAAKEFQYYDVTFGSEDARDAMSREEIRLAFWEHFAVVTGRDVVSRDSPFSCSC